MGNPVENLPCSRMPGRTSSMELTGGIKPHRSDRQLRISCTKRITAAQNGWALPAPVSDNGCGIGATSEAATCEG
jgi:hypothetical protein